MLFTGHGVLSYADSISDAISNTGQTTQSKVHRVSTPTKPTISRIFQVVYHNMGMQSVAYNHHFFFVGYATSTNRTVIQKYDMKGHLVAETGILPILHCASISVAPATGHLIVTNGGGTDPTRVYVVDFNSQKILSSINLSSLGNAGVSAVDKSTGNLWVETAPNDHGEQTFSYVNLSGRVLKQFTLPNQGVPQGIDVKHGLIYFYTDNKITVISQAGNVLRHIDIQLPHETESEGMAMLPSGQIVIGYQWRHAGKIINTLYKLTGFK